MFLEKRSRRSPSSARTEQVIKSEHFTKIGQRFGVKHNIFRKQSSSTREYLGKYLNPRKPSVLGFSSFDINSSDRIRSAINCLFVPLAGTCNAWLSIVETTAGEQDREDIMSRRREYHFRHAPFDTTRMFFDNVMKYRSRQLIFRRTRWIVFLFLSFFDAGRLK